jgi:hypothetical protein
VPNQDALDWYPRCATAPVAAVAIADGHGSPSCFRSGTGAALAVQAVLAILSEATAENGRLRQAAEWLPERLTGDWRRAVETHIQENPYSKREAAAAGRTPWLPYGSTVLSVVALPDLLVGIQLGDGDILLVSDGGEVRRPWPHARKAIGLETESLCTEDAPRQMRIFVETEALPALILLSTDGYANSFREDAGFLQIGGDVLAIIQEEGIGSLEANLEGWLAEASAKGSGDDITLAGLCRMPEGESHGDA